MTRLITRYPDLPELPKELVDDFVHGRVVLFLGAGVSMSVGGPSWEGLVNPLRDRLQQYAGVDYLDLPQVVSLARAHDGDGAIAPLFDELRKTRELSVHRKLVKLPVKLILTTNYDPYLQQAAEQEQIPHDLVSLDKQIYAAGNDRLTIVHLYGNTDSALVTEEDLMSFDRVSRARALLLDHALLTKRVLFLGFSFRDFNVLNHHLAAHDAVRPSSPTRHHAFMLLPGENDAFVKLWAERHLKILGVQEVPPDEMSRMFVAFVEKLSDAVQVRASEPIERETVVHREEQQYFDSTRNQSNGPTMRRESTFSVLALPDDFASSGLKDPEGHRRGIERKRLFEKWIRYGRLNVILNADPAFAARQRGYRKADILVRLEELRRFIIRHQSSPGFAIMIRSKPVLRDSYASLGEEVLFVTENKKKVKQRAQVFRDRLAVGVFNSLFDQEMSLYAHAADTQAGKQKIGSQRRQALANKAALRQIEQFIRNMTRR